MKNCVFLHFSDGAGSPPAASQQDPEYMEQPSPTNDSKHLQEDTERAISRAASEQEERSPEALLNAVCKTHRHIMHLPHTKSLLHIMYLCQLYNYYNDN